MSRNGQLGNVVTTSLFMTLLLLLLPNRESEKDRKKRFVCNCIGIGMEFISKTKEEVDMCTTTRLLHNKYLSRIVVLFGNKVTCLLLLYKQQKYYPKFFPGQTIVCSAIKSALFIHVKISHFLLHKILQECDISHSIPIYM